MLRFVLSVVVFVAIVCNAESKLGWHKHRNDWHKDENDANNNQNTNCDNLQPNRDEVEPTKDADKAFDELAKEIMAEDKIKLQYCNIHSHPGATEVYGDKNYKLIIPLKDFDSDNIQVKIKHRVIYMKGEVPQIDPRWSENDDGSWTDIRTLPYNLDAQKATWLLKNGNLEVTIPYKFVLNKEWNKTCEVDYGVVNEREIVVPQGMETEIDQDLIDQIFNGK